MAKRRARRSTLQDSKLRGASEIRSTLALLSILSGASAAQASDAPLNFELTPFGGYRFGGTFDIAGSDDAYELDDSAAFGLILNLREKHTTQWELLYSTQSTDAELSAGTGLRQSVGIDTHILQIGGTYQGQEDTVRPYVAVTLGGTHISSEADSDTFFSGSLGLGLQVMPNERLGLRLEVRGYATLTDSDTDLFCRTGPDQNICAVRVDGEILGQIETFAGLVVRF